MLETDEKFGFIVVDGSGALFGLVSGSNREVLYEIQVDLPKKHGRGGQSALRFARYAEHCDTLKRVHLFSRSCCVFCIAPTATVD